MGNTGRKIIAFFRSNGLSNESGLALIEVVSVLNSGDAVARTPSGRSTEHTLGVQQPPPLGSAETNGKQEIAPKTSYSLIYYS